MDPDKGKEDGKQNESEEQTAEQTTEQSSETTTTSEEQYRPADDILQLGDKITFEGGIFKGTTAYIYYRSPTRILLFPEGASVKPGQIPMIRVDVDGTETEVPPEGEDPVEDASYFINPKYGPVRPTGKHNKNRIVIINGDEYEENVAFVVLTDLKEGQFMTTYDKKNGSPSTVYKIVKVNKEKDSVILAPIDEPKRTLEIEFNYEGIPSDVPFDFFHLDTPIDLFQSPSMSSEEEEEEKKTEETRDDDDGEDLLLDDDNFQQILSQNIGQARKYEIEYDDDAQRNEMYKDLMKREEGMTEAASRNPVRLRKNKILLEQLFALRNDLVEYLPDGFSVKGSKKTSFETIDDILKEGNVSKEVKIPLARPIVDAKRSLFYDHSAEYYEQKRAEGVDKTSSSSSQIDLHYLSDNIEGSKEYLVKNMTSTKKEEKMELLESSQLPKFYAVLQDYFTKYTPYLVENGEGQTVTTSDNDVFRGDIPIFSKIKDDGKGKIDGLPRLGKSDQDGLESTNIGKIHASRMRTITGRSVRLKNNTLRGVENSDVLNVLYYLFFPFLYLREFGSTRTGDLALDIAQSMLPTRTMNMILENNGPITEKEVGSTEEGKSEESEINPDKILPIKEGSALINLKISEWLKGQPIFGRGIGDLLPMLSSLGLRYKDFNEEQMKVLLQKVEQYRNALTMFLNEERTKAEDEMGKTTVEPNLLVPEKSLGKLLSILKNDQKNSLIITALNDFAVRYPAYVHSDIAQIAYLHILYPDVLMDKLAEKKISYEYIRAVRKEIFTRAKNKILEKHLEETAGQKPVPNPCHHVKDYETILLVKNVEQRSKLLEALIGTYGELGTSESQWIDCRLCEQHLVCQHEKLLVKEKTDPSKSKIYRKKIILDFSDGSFMGHYICGNCGQAIQELEYDDNAPTNDDGKRMAGFVVDKEDESKDEIETELGSVPVDNVEPVAPVFTGKNEDEIKLQKKIYNAMSKLTRILGVSIDKVIYERIIPNVAELYDATLLDMDDYEDAIKKRKKRRQEQLKIQEAAAKEGKKAPPQEKQEADVDYPTYASRHLVTLVSCSLLIEIQTSEQEYDITNSLEGCSASFSGYPLDTNDKNRIGIDYIACGIATITDNEDPWKNTGYQKIENLQLRRNEIGKNIYSYLKQKYSIRPEVIKKLEDKRAYEEKTYGRSSGSSFIKEKLPDGFVPNPIIVPKDEKAREPLLEMAAKDIKYVARAWFILAHEAARKGSKISLTSRQTSITCCIDRIDKPLHYWADKKLPALGTKEAPLGNRGSFLRLPLTLRPPADTLGQNDPKKDQNTMAKLFLKVCFSGPREGYPHEPGYDLKCMNCGYQYPYDPREPILPVITKEIIDKKVKFDKMIQLGYQEAEKQRLGLELESVKDEKIKFGPATFETLLDTMHNHYLVENPSVAKIEHVDIGLLEDLNKLNTYEKVPFVNTVPEGGMFEYNALLTQTIENIKELMTKQSATAYDYAAAYNPVREKVPQISAVIKSVLDKTDVDLFMKMFERMQKGESGAKLAQVLYSSYLLPFQRSITKVNIKSKIKAPYGLGLGPAITNDIKSLLENHWMQEQIFDPEFTSTKKLIEARDRLIIIIDMLQNKIRVNTVPGATVKVADKHIIYYDLVFFLVGGIFADLLNPVLYPREVTGKKSKHQQEEMKDIKKFISKILAQGKKESLDFTDAQIREIIEQRDEQDRRGILGKFKSLTPDMKPLELEKKKYKIGDWAAGKNIYTYSEDQYVREQIRREQVNTSENEITDIDIVEEGATEEDLQEADNAYDNTDPNDHEDVADAGENAGGVSC